ncbi:LiaI-LiaF-like domain-containing protein [Undibacterium sp. TC4M20W]|uniref:LiaI-LiaF-like domain-containing protein n=1 Tax=Undibacterium sp. TC4M20W TaxID=3413052 RepID=UPI003BF2F4A9
MKNNNPQGRILIGGMLLIFGALALLDNLNLFNVREVFHFWPMVFIFVGALKISKSDTTAGYIIGCGFVGLGALLILHHMGIIYFRMRDWWPVFMIFAGLMVIFKGKIGDQEKLINNGTNQDAICNIVAVMSGNKLQNSSQEFRGGEINCIMGGVELDLRAASMQSEATLNVFAMWGGIVLKIPNDWTVVSHGSPILGGFDDKTVPPMLNAKKLYIKGYAVMGGVEIIN